jgi:hypothetical protein
MATAAKAKSKTTPTDGARESEYDKLVASMKRHAPPFRTAVPCMRGRKKSFQVTVPKPVAVPSAYGGKPVALQPAATILQKGYVGFYLMCIYMNAGVKKTFSPALLKLLKARRTFTRKSWMMGLGAKSYKERGWVGASGEHSQEWLCHEG